MPSAINGKDVLRLHVLLRIEYSPSKAQFPGTAVSFIESKRQYYAFKYVVDVLILSWMFLSYFSQTRINIKTFPSMVRTLFGEVGFPYKVSTAKYGSCKHQSNKSERSQSCRKMPELWCSHLTFREDVWVQANGKEGASSTLVKKSFEEHHLVGTFSELSRRAELSFG